MKRVLLTTAAAIGLFASSAHAFQAAPSFPQPDLRHGHYLECAIVAHTRDNDRNPAYKVNVALEIDEGQFHVLGYFLHSGERAAG